MFINIKNIREKILRKEINFIILVLYILTINCNQNLKSEEIDIEYICITQQKLLNSFFPEADSFLSTEYETEKYFNAYSDQKIIGYVFIGKNEGFTGPVISFTGIDISGVCVKVEIVEHEETPRYFELLIGNKFFSQFELIDLKIINLSERDFLEYTVDAVSSATYSSNAVIDNFWDAVRLFSLIK